MNPRFENAISTGQLLIAAPLIVSAVIYFSGTGFQTTENQKQLMQLRVDMTAQMTQMKTDMTAQAVAMRSDIAAQMAQLQVNSDKQFNMVRSDIANIPGMKERVDALDKHVDQSDIRYDALGKRVDGVQQLSTQNSADIANILRRSITK